MEASCGDSTKDEHRSRVKLIATNRSKVILIIFCFSTLISSKEESIQNQAQQQELKSKIEASQAEGG